MAQNPNNKKAGQKKEAASGAMKFLLAGCVAELYLLLVRRFYVNGTLRQVVAWDTALQVLLFVGLGALVLGVVLAAVWRRACGWKRTLAWCLVGAGVLLSAGNWLIRASVPTGTTVLCVVVPVVALLAILWVLYDRECAISLTVLGAALLVLWVSRRSAGNVLWRTRVVIGACVFVALAVLVALVVYRAERAGGVLRGRRILPAAADCLVIYLSCGLAAVVTVLGLLSAAAAYYAIWVVAILGFALAGYYTVKQL
jgi:hypothetical protein